MPYLDQIQLRGKRVLVRSDLNVPIDQGTIRDDNRIRASVPTYEHILNQGAALVICSHMGKPKGDKDPSLSLRPVADRLQELLGRKVKMAPDCVGDEVKSMADALQPGQVLLLENLRFHSGETKNDPEFSRQLGSLAEVYVDDAFGVVHRAHASVVGVTEHVDSACAGLLLQKEVEYLGKAMADPDHPFVLVAGGAKVSTKLGILTNLLDTVDRIIVGGAMANTFLRSMGVQVGSSKVEEDLIDQALQTMQTARSKGVSFYLPVDCLTAADIKAAQPSGVFPFQDVPREEMILDIGPATHTLFAEVLRDAKTVVWNGPMGAFENPSFSQGSVGLAQSVAKVDGLTIVGGGDTDALVHTCGLVDSMSFISTGGGSFLEFLEGKKLPGIQALGL
ncbi:phosphoglycerate kinase [Desulfovermiculus halophilus]|jgi:phosphoglycerate kinase|uniref:phosphoglycerate kinase n=1 Tax=Desulfovermiculus halophilus TaxID=339722 RepID=UPI000489DF0C|nr:phosphoglycerate kinase [Desulfovermiculus halophilus]